MHEQTRVTTITQAALLLSMHRYMHLTASSLALQMFQKKIVEMGADGDPKGLMDESSEELQRILAPLTRAEEAVKYALVKHGNLVNLDPPQPHPTQSDLGLPPANPLPRKLPETRPFPRPPRGLTKELELFRKSEIGKAFSRASNLSHELVVHKKEASAAQHAAE